MTAADLPNAFPYFIAIERLLNANVSGLTGVAVIAGYAAIYCLPCVVLVVIGSVAQLFRSSFREGPQAIR
jgi:hypothetical protein